MSLDYSHYKALKFNRPKERILEVIISNPGKLNALDEDGHRELSEVWRDVDKDPDTSVVLLRGDGGVYSAGGDLKLVEKMANDWDTKLRAWKEAHDIVYNIINCTKPIVSAIEGPAVGAGLAAAIMADISVAGRTARIIDGHTRLGVAAGDHAAIIWPLLCGMAKAKYYLLLCETVTGEEAERIGLVSLCADDDKVVSTAMQVCEKLAAGAQVSIRWTKHALNNWLRMAGPTFDTSLALEFIGFSGPEVREGYAALQEKRKPKFDPTCPF
jgi:enoyl-CoA hydratase